MALSRLLITGASGFLGRHLLDALKEDYEIYAIARRSQKRCGAPVHPNIKWFQVDIGEREHLTSIFDRIQRAGGAHMCIHLAAHYDFTGERHAEYHRTNVDGLRNVLDLCRDLGLQRFVFSSSVAACAFPKAGTAITEETPPDGDHLYAETKRLGEKMLPEYSDSFPSVIVRFAAMFSDWCEYPPLFMFLQTWLSSAWNRNVLGGKGESAVPYLHVRDAVAFLQAIIDLNDHLDDGEILNASTDGSISHEDLFEHATFHYSGRRRRPIHIPKLLALPGMYVMFLIGKLTGELPFERPWMGKYIDLKLTVDATRTRSRLGWSPRPRLEILRRLPFLLENFRMDPIEWGRRNRAAMRQVRLRPNLKIHWLLEKHEAEISEEFTGVLTGERGKELFPSYQLVPEWQHEWNHRLILRQLLNAIRTRERAVFHSYCRDMAADRYRKGFQAEEVCRALNALAEICVRRLREDPESRDVDRYIHDHIEVTIEFGSDQVQETFELMAQQDSQRRGRLAPMR